MIRGRMGNFLPRITRITLIQTRLWQRMGFAYALEYGLAKFSTAAAISVDQCHQRHQRLGFFLESLLKAFLYRGTLVPIWPILNSLSNASRPVSAWKSASSKSSKASPSITT